MKNTFIGGFLMLLIMGLFSFKNNEYNPNSPIYYNTAGRVVPPSGARVAIFDDYITPGQATSNVVDYSSAHFIGDPVISITPEQNTTAITAIPMTSIQTKSKTSCTVNIVTSNQQLVSALGTNITGLVAATGLATMKLHVRAKGYTMDQP